MLTTLMDFAACCRAWELRVSTAEVLDCARQLEQVSLLSEPLVKTVLRANFAKSRRAQKKFDQVYDFFFHQIPGPHTDSHHLPLPAQTSRTMADLARELEETAHALPFGKALLAMMTGSPARFMEEAMALHTRPEAQARFFKSNLGQLSLKLDAMLAIGKIREMALARIRAQTSPPGSHAHVKQAMASQVNQAMDTAATLLSEEAGHYNDSLKQSGLSAVQRDEDLGKAPFPSLDISQQKEMKKLVEKLARKLRDQASRRHIRKNRGPLDVKKTLRLASQSQGVPLKLAFKNRDRKKGKIVALCDVSGSVQSTARFMLMLLFSLQACFDRVKSFVFVSGLAEVTPLFDRLPLDDALDQALTRALDHPGERTDYGAAFAAFERDHLNSLDKKTTLIILGDGRSNYQNPQAHRLAKFREKSVRLLWLTPEPAATWHTGDSEIRTYQPHCHALYTCMTLEHLERIVREMVV